MSREEKLIHALEDAKPYVILYLKDRAKPNTVGEEIAEDVLDNIDLLLEEYND